jgi:predicted dehydrogenase
MKKITLAAAGCGARTQQYLSIAAQLPEQYEIVAAADPKPQRVNFIKNLSRNSNFKRFEDYSELLDCDKLADVLVIGTQDEAHFEPCKKGLLKGYNILLEKPIATSLNQIIELESIAKTLKRKVLICHVLRYTFFYQKIKEIIDSGTLGRIISLNAVEGVIPWHQAHSFVRGHWSVTQKSSPMIVAKCCHDMDLIYWLLDSPCLRLSSFGDLTFFNEQNAPQNAPLRCTDKCPEASNCPFNASLYAGLHREPWLAQIYDNYKDASKEEIIHWLKFSPWGRCVFRCNNNAVDHQVIIMEFDNSATATFTMTAFENGRHLEIYGTHATLKAHMTSEIDTMKTLYSDIKVTYHNTGKTETFPVKAASHENLDEEFSYNHGGGDVGLMVALYDQMSKNCGSMDSELSKSVHSHVMAFAAEEARITGETVDIQEFYNKNCKTNLQFVC